jgi:hypothetical protein
MKYAKIIKYEFGFGFDYQTNCPYKVKKNKLIIKVDSDECAKCKYNLIESNSSLEILCSHPKIGEGYESNSKR